MQADLRCRLQLTKLLPIRYVPVRNNYIEVSVFKALACFLQDGYRFCKVLDTYASLCKICQRCFNAVIFFLCPDKIGTFQMRTARIFKGMLLAGTQDFSYEGIWTILLFIEVCIVYLFKILPLLSSHPPFFVIVEYLQ